jgi:hypothetical protein
MEKRRMHVTESEAASMYARACRAWYGRRAQKVAKAEIKRLRGKNDESGVRMRTLVAEQLLGGRGESTVLTAPALASADSAAKPLHEAVHLTRRPGAVPSRRGNAALVQAGGDASHARNAGGRQLFDYREQVRSHAVGTSR